MIVAGPQPGTVRVLLVDDTAMLRGIVRTHLDRTGRYVVVAEAGNGVDGLAAARRARPDLVVLDLQMDVMDGATALPQLRELLPEARIVIFTGHDHESLWPQLSAAGADAAIGKGTRLAEVVATLDTLCWP